MLRRLGLTVLLVLGSVAFLVAGLGVGFLIGLDSWRRELRRVWR